MHCSFLSCFHLNLVFCPASTLAQHREQTTTINKSKFEMSVMTFDQVCRHLNT
jgi:hypothetical protein